MKHSRVRERFRHNGFGPVFVGYIEVKKCTCILGLCNVGFARASNVQCQTSVERPHRTSRGRKFVQIMSELDAQETCDLDVRGTNDLYVVWESE